MSVAILGGGISGLSLLHFLRTSPGGTTRNFGLFEKSNRPGGWVQTNLEGYTFEESSRSLRVSGGDSTVSLISSLGLHDEVIMASSEAKKRMVFHDKKIQTVPNSILGLLTNKMTRPYVLPVLKEPFIKRKITEDESIYNFFSRRFGTQITEEMVSAMVYGIYGGDTKKLSVKSCFPKIRKFEIEYGSVLSGILRNYRNKEKEPLTEEGMLLRDRIRASGGVYSFKRGLSQLTHTIAQQHANNIEYNANVVAISPTKLDGSQGAEVIYEKLTPQSSTQTKIKANLVVSTLPAYTLASLVKPLSPPLAQALESIYHADIATVNIGYPSEKLPMQGFGYLIPPKEHQQILGVVFDSSTFPQHNHQVHETRVTVMMGGDSNKVEVQQAIKKGDIKFLQNRALCALKEHLGISVEPEFIRVNIFLGALPQYHVGHEKILKNIEILREQYFPWLRISGHSFYGVGVNSCIHQANLMAKELSTTQKY